MNMELGTAIKLIRTSSGLKQKDIATKLGVTPNYISLVENGSREPSISLLKKLATIFDVPVGLFFLWEGDDASSTKNTGRLRNLLVELEAMYVFAKKSRPGKRSLA
jgi:transcriptional regulator with XRE-family HTH domain